MSSLIFYPHEDDSKGTVEERLDIMLESAERYKAVLLDIAAKSSEPAIQINGHKRLTPKDLVAAFNWDGISKLLREIREMPENSAVVKSTKATYLNKLAEIYEILRAAKMPKLEAVRLALINEANQIRGSQVA